MKYQYSIVNDTATGVADSYYLETEITDSTLPEPTYVKIINSSDLIELEFSPALSQGEETQLTNLIAAHAGDTLQNIKVIVNNAIKFFQELMVEYAAENVSMGITQAGKTKEVADYLATVMRYGQSGSLYEVVNEVDVLIAEPPPASIDPFVTVSRLQVLKAKVESYLGI